MLSDKDLEEAVAATIAARGGKRPFKRLPPGGAPLTLDDAYAIQEAFATGVRPAGRRLQDRMRVEGVASAGRSLRAVRGAHLRAHPRGFAG